MKVCIIPMNTCTTRRQKVAQYRKYFEQNGHTLVERPADAEKVLVWTCAFRKDVRDSSLAEIEHLTSLGFDVVVGGCLPDIDPQLLASNHSGEILRWKADSDFLSEIFGNEVVKINDINPVHSEIIVCEDLELYKKQNPSADVQFYDQFNKLFVSEGCPLACSYCSERITFPKFRSFSTQDIEQECRQLINSTGEYRIALLADSLGDYGMEIGSSFPSLLKRLRLIDSRIQFVLFNFNPFHIIKYRQEFTDMFRKNYFYHINLPMQSGSDKILRLMERPYTVQDLENIFLLFSKTSFHNFDTHIIIGFPGETDEDFRLTCDFILKHHPNHVLISGCMLNDNIPAAKLSDKIPESEIDQRKIIAERLFKDAGIICNTDGSGHMQKRFRERICGQLHHPTQED